MRRRIHVCCTHLCLYTYLIITPYCYMRYDTDSLPIGHRLAIHPNY